MLASQAGSKDLSAHGIVNSGTVHWNLGTEPLYENTIANGLGTITAGGALMLPVPLAIGVVADTSGLVPALALLLLQPLVILVVALLVSD